MSDCEQLRHNLHKALPAPNSSTRALEERILTDIVGRQRGSGRRHQWSTMTATVLLVTLIVTTLTVVGHASRTRPRAAQVPLSAATQTHRQVYFLSSQGQPPKEAQALQANVLHGFDLAVDFNSEPTAAQGIEQILQESGTGSVTVDLTAHLEGDMRTLEAAGALEDLTPLVT